MQNARTIHCRWILSSVSDSFCFRQRERRSDRNARQLPEADIHFPFQVPLYRSLSGGKIVFEKGYGYADNAEEESHRSRTPASNWHR